MIEQIQVSTHGAELQSIMANGREYLWQGDQTFWGRRAPILFPIVGRLANDTLRIEGREYPMKQHGFARDAEFVERDGWYMLAEEGRVNHPYAYELAVRYSVVGNTLTCNWQVTNHGDDTMHFQIGAHPAFLLPDFDANDDIHGFIRFYDKNDNTISPMVHYYLDGGLRRAYDKPMALNNNEGLLALNDKTFENDALLIEGSQVAGAALLNKAGHEVLRVSCPQAEAFGIWAPYKPGCPFVCIEPWCGMADRYDFRGDITEREYNHSLKPGETYLFSYSIQIHK
jgi:galactose mutarotase-like enzyme